MWTRVSTSLLYKCLHWKACIFLGNGSLSMAAWLVSFREGVVVPPSMVKCLVKKATNSVYVHKFHIYHHGKHMNFVSHPSLQLDSLTGKFICRFSTKGCVLIQLMWVWLWNFQLRLKSKLSNLMATLKSVKRISLLSN